MASLPSFFRRTNIAIVITCLSFLKFGCSSPVEGEDEAPNILFILVDDQGYGDTGHTCENSTGMCALTPHIDALAHSPHSAVFHRFYSAAGVCSPTRAALL